MNLSKVVILLSLGISSLNSFAFLLGEKAAYRDALDKSVYISIKKGKDVLSKGAGFFYGSGEYIITNHHVMAPFLKAEDTKILVTRKSGELASLSDISIVKCGDPDSKIDLCLLKVKGSGQKKFYSASSVKIGENQLVSSVGHCGRHNFVVKTSRTMKTFDLFARINSSGLGFQYEHSYNVGIPLLQLKNSTLCKGDSGGPVFETRRGSLIGVVTEITDLREESDLVKSLQQKFVMAIPASTVLDFYNRNKNFWGMAIKSSRIEHQKSEQDARDELTERLNSL